MTTVRVSSESKTAPLFGATAGREAEVIREFWRNGEGWYRLRCRASGEEFDSPDVFWAEAEEEGLTFVVPPTAGDPPVRSGELEAVNRERGITPPEHDCDEHPVPYESDGALGHGWECGVCGAFLQAG